MIKGGRETNRYGRILEHIFAKKYRKGATTVEFEREDIVRAAEALGIELPKNLGDLIYSFRYRAELPSSIIKKAPPGRVWLIRPTGRSRYAFAAVVGATTTIKPNAVLAETKVPDATPGIIGMYALNDEQALLAVLRYNRLIDVFTGVTCYSLQSHLRTTVRDMGQVETDEIYVGVDRRGAHFVVPVQAKGGSDSISLVQIEQDLAMCKQKFSGALCRAVAAQFMDDNLIALFEFEPSDDGIRIVSERHYRLTPGEELTGTEISAYNARPSNDINLG